MIALNSSHELILSPAETDVTSFANDSLSVSLSADLNTTTNGLGAGAIHVPCIFPNVSYASAAQDHFGRPIVTHDHFLRTKSRTLINAIGKSNEHNLNDKDVKLITQQLNEKQRVTNTSHVNNVAHAFRRHLPDEYCAMVRPVQSHTAEIMPVLGIPRNHAYPISSEETGWNFYRSNVLSQNPYASSLGSLYQNRFSRNNVCVGKDRSFQLVSSCYSLDDVASSTTVILENLYDFNNIHESSFTPEEQAQIHAYNARTDNNADEIKVEIPSFKGSSVEDTGGKRACTTAYGYSVPYSSSTDAQRITDLQQNATKRGSLLYNTNKPFDYTILSSYSVPDDV